MGQEHHALTNPIHDRPLDRAQIDAFVFDVIGTLVDEDAAWARAAERICAATGLSRPADFHARWATVLSDRMGAVVSGRDSWQPHQQLVSDAAEEAITGLGGTATRETAAMVASLDREYLAWPDVSDATGVLRRHGLVIGVSNGDLDSLARLSSRGAINWDLALSTGAAQTFKPAPAAYEYAIHAAGIDPSRTLFVASHPWDLRAAAHHGFRTAFVARPGAELPTGDDRFDLAVSDLLALAELFS